MCIRKLLVVIAASLVAFSYLAIEKRSPQRAPRVRREAQSALGELRAASEREKRSEPRPLGSGPSQESPLAYGRGSEVSLKFSAPSASKLSQPDSNGTPNQSPTAPSKAQVAEVMEGLPLSFEKNEGQADGKAGYFSRIGNQAVFFARDGVIFPLEKKTETRRFLSSVMLKFAGANSNAEISGEEILPSKSNYFIGNNPADWKTDIPQYAKVRYKQLYPGIDVVFYGNRQQLEYDVIVAPGADPSIIALTLEEAAATSEPGTTSEPPTSVGGPADLTNRSRAVPQDRALTHAAPTSVAVTTSEASTTSGAGTTSEPPTSVGGPADLTNRSRAVSQDRALTHAALTSVTHPRLQIDSKGDLIIKTSAREIRQLKPTIYQEINGVKFPVPGRYVIKQAVSYQQAAVSSQTSSVISQRSSAISRQTAGGSRQTGLQVRRSGQQVETVQDRQLSTTDHGQRTTDQSKHSAFPIPHSALDEIRNSQSAIRNGNNPKSAIRNWAVTFHIDAYDKSKPLVIDPRVIASFTIPGGKNQQPIGIASDAQGNWYLAGATDSLDFQTRNPIQPSIAGCTARPCEFDAFVMKLSADTKTIIYSTYLGGTASDEALGIAVDSGGSAYVIGETFSTNFPTRNPIQAANGGRSVFIAKLSADGSSLVYSTYLGGSASELAGGIAVDSSGNAYVAGKTNSADFPTRNALQSTFSGSTGFIAKLNAGGSALVYSTLFGTGTDIHGIAVDSSGNAYVAGDAGTIPSPSGFQRTPGGGGDAFVAKLNSAGSALVYSTYLGGSALDQGLGIAIDASGSAYISGMTQSINFPTASPFQTTNGGKSDVFVAKLNAAGTALTYSSYLGGSEDDSASGIAVDSAGRAYVGGTTSSANFPVKAATQPAYGGNSDFFVTQLSTAGAIEFSTYIGTAAGEYSNAIALGRPKALKVADDATTYQTQEKKPPVGTGGDKEEGGSTGLFVTFDLDDIFPTEPFEDNCIRIIKPDREINGKQSRPIGSQLAYTVVPTKPPTDGQLFLHSNDGINKAFQFSAKEKETDRTIDIEEGDIVKLLPCPPFVQAVSIPKSYPNGTRLRNNSLVGSGKGINTIKSPGGGFVISVDGENVTIQSLTIDGNNAARGIVTGPNASGFCRMTDLTVENLGANLFGIDVSGLTTLIVEGRTSEDQLTVQSPQNRFITGIRARLGGNGEIVMRNVQVTPGHDEPALDLKANTRVSLTDTGGFGDILISPTDPTSKIGDVFLTRVWAVEGGFSIRRASSVNVTSGGSTRASRNLGIDSGYGFIFGDVSSLALENVIVESAYFDGIRLRNSHGSMRTSRTSENIGDGIGLRNNSTLDLQSGTRIVENFGWGISQDSNSNVTGIKVAVISKNKRGGVYRIPAERGGPDVAAKAAAAAPGAVEDTVIFGNGGPGFSLGAADQIDFGGGGGGSGGGNIFAGNAGFDLVNGSGVRIFAKNNIWSSSDPNEILSKYVSPGAGVDVAPVMPVQAKYFAQFAEAPGFTSTVTLTNPSRTNGAAALLAFRNSAGNYVNVPLNGRDALGGVQPGTVAPLGAGSFSTNSTTTAVNVGSMTAASGRPLAGTVLFSGPAGVAGVGASELLTQFIAPVGKSASRSINSGIAIINPNTTAAVTVALRLRESSTGKITEGTLQLPAGGQAAKFIDELFSGLSSEFTGTLSVSAAAQMAATVIRTSPGQFATLPVTGTGSKKLLFAQFGEVTGVSSTLTFVNPSLDKTASVTVKIFDDNGAPLTVNLGGQDRPGQFTFSVPPQTAVSFASPGTSTAAKVGSVVVDSTENIGGTILFGGSFGLAGVGASQALSNFIAPVEQTTQGGVTVGLAMMNVGTAQATVKLTLRDESGTPVASGTVDVVLKPQGHVAKFLGQFFDKLSLADFRGTITGETTGQIGATVIRQSTVPLEFATLPVAEIIP